MRHLLQYQIRQAESEFKLVRNISCECKHCKGTSTENSPEGHQTPKYGIKDLHNYGVARNDRKSPLVDPVVKWPVLI